MTTRSEAKVKVIRWNDEEFRFQMDGDDVEARGFETDDAGWLSPIASADGLPSIRSAAREGHLTLSQSRHGRATPGRALAEIDIHGRGGVREEHLGLEPGFGSGCCGDQEDRPGEGQAPAVRPSLRRCISS